MNKRKLVQDIQKLSDKWGLNDEKKQHLKIFEEFGELCKAELENDIDEIKDGIGDVFITILVASKIGAGEVAEGASLETIVKEINQHSKNNPSLMNTELTDDALKYVLRTMYIIIQKHNIDHWKCIEAEYKKVSKRTGRTVNGTFLKDKKL